MKKLNVNTINQLVSAILMALAMAGLQVNVDLTAAQISGAISSAQWSMLGMVAVNLGTAVYYWVQNMKDKSYNFWAFLHSKNWWLTFSNFVVGVLVYFGINVSEAGAHDLVHAVFGDTGLYGIVVALMANVVFPVIQRFIPKAQPQAPATLNYNTAAR